MVMNTTTIMTTGNIIVLGLHRQGQMLRQSDDEWMTSGTCFQGCLSWKTSSLDLGVD